MSNLWNSFCKNVLDYEGSTRPVALMRIGLVFLMWARWGGEWLPFRGMLYLSPLMHVLGISFYIFTFLMFLGKWTRFSTFCTAVTLLAFYYYAGFVRGFGEYTHHHTYFLAVATLFLSLTPCGKSFSWDRYNEVNRALKSNMAVPEERGPLWATRLIALQISVIYLFSAYHKTYAAFFSGERLEHMAMHWYFGSDYPPFPGFQFTMFICAFAVVVLEYILAFGLWFPKIRKPLMICGILFHLLLYWLLPVRTFTMTICLLYLAYLPPQKVHDWIDRVVQNSRTKYE